MLASGLGGCHHDEESMDLLWSQNCVAEDLYVLSQKNRQLRSAQELDNIYKTHSI